MTYRDKLVLTKQVGIRMPADIAEYMHLHKEVNWSNVMRDLLRDYINRRQMTVSKSTIDKEGVLIRFCAEVGGQLIRENEKVMCRINNEDYEHIDISFDEYENRLSIEVEGIGYSKITGLEKPKKQKTLEFTCEGESEMSCIAGKRL